MTETNSTACVPRPAWIKGKITGPKAPLRPGHVRAIRQAGSGETHARLGLSISPLTANCVAVTSLHCASMMWRLTAMRLTEPISVRGSPAGRSLCADGRHGSLSTLGSGERHAQVLGSGGRCGASHSRPPGRHGSRRRGEPTQHDGAAPVETDEV
jgi:hypothetical protein